MSRPRKAVVHRRKGSPHWHYKWIVQGVVIRGSTGTDDKALAEEIALHARQDLIEQVRLGRKPAMPEMTVDEALGRYWAEHAGHLASARTLRSQMKALHAGLGPDTLLSAIDDAMVARYVALRRAVPRPLVQGSAKRQKGPGGRKPGTVNLDLVTLGAVLRRAQEVWQVKVGTAKPSRHKLPERRRPEVFLDRSQAERLIAAIVPHGRAPVALALMTGLRSANVLGLDWDEHVSLSEARITLTVKGGKTHTVPLAPAAVELLAGLAPKAAQRHGPVFRFGNPHVACGCPVCASCPGQRILSIKKSFATARRSIGLAVRFHDLRHTFASWLIQSGAGIKVARDLLGHSDLKTTDRYAHLESDAGSRAVAVALAGFGRPRQSGASLGANKAQATGGRLRRHS